MDGEGRRALVVGCGYVGSELAWRLGGEGWRVWGVRRSVEGLPDGVTAVRADVSDPRTLRGVLSARPDVVVYAVSADRRTEGAYRAAYVDGLRNVIQALEDGGVLPKRLLFVSSTAVYGGRDGAWLDEESSPEPTGFRGRVLLEAEAVATSGTPERVSGVVLRLGGIYGPGRTSLIEKVRAGEARCPPDGPYFTNRIHRSDAAGALVHLATLERPDPVYLGVDREPAPYCDVLRWLAARMGVPPPPSGDDGSLQRRKRTNKRCRSDRIVGSGFTFRYPSFREGYGELLSSD